ncbi:hypothetical protein GCM10011571_09290 [Marinithermofilum abyssi]|uniref:Tetratricopeptide repeat protein n=1 Tax=Marinithermofilum abyssi TaxID=1571185 RepID=A0A8J2VEN7_9BACL|nr:tetratricopeptide repeat protein [Marinithermofilum abyssi]GGE10104.1 hypothetical protein GCM10011571_09290 [Marinithermofilum abyssi]
MSRLRNNFQTKRAASVPRKISLTVSSLLDQVKQLLHANEIREAKHRLQKETDHLQKHPEFMVLLGEINDRLGLWEEAVHIFQQAAAQTNDPAKKANILCQMAEIAEKMGQSDDSQEWLLQGLDAYPHDETALQALARHAAASGAEDSEVRSKLQVFLPPSSVHHVNPLARTLIHIGAYREAANVLENESELTPEGKQLFAHCLIHGGRYEEALVLLHTLCREISDENAITPFHLDIALCAWTKQIAAAPLFDTIHTPNVFTWMDDWIIRQKSTPCPISERDLFLEHWIKRAVGYRMIKLADRFSQLGQELPLILTHQLYDDGFIHCAADRLHQLKDLRMIDEEGIHRLAEYFYDQGTFDRAAALWEDLSKQQPKWEKGRIGAALSYFHIANQVLSEIRSPIGKNSTSYWKKRIHIDHSIQLLNRTGWHTRWTFAQRRNAHWNPSKPFDSRKAEQFPSFAVSGRKKAPRQTSYLWRQGVSDLDRERSIRAFLNHVTTLANVHLTAVQHTSPCQEILIAARMGINQIRSLRCF